VVIDVKKLSVESLDGLEKFFGHRSGLSVSASRHQFENPHKQRGDEQFHHADPPRSP